MKEVKNRKFDEERALYAIENTAVINCRFEGPADGESAFKETKDIVVKDSYFALRYPFWHTKRAILDTVEMTDTCRAALWYDNDITIRNSTMHGIKALRECDHVLIEDSQMVSPEFGWLCRNIKIKDTELTAEYSFFYSKDMELDNFTLHGKYSFQYVENLVIRNSNLDIKDAFWHSKNVTVYDSVVKGEYLAWYSENLRLVRCKIIGTQPLCYAKGLILEDCEMIDTDLSFEYSDVQATIKGNIVSVKNPTIGYIKADSIGEVIIDENCEKGADCKISICQTV